MEPLAEPVVDFLADEQQPVRVVDFLSDTTPETGGAVFCDPLKGGCGHFLTCHSRGMTVYDRCLIAGCGCERARL